MVWLLFHSVGPEYEDIVESREMLDIYVKKEMPDYEIIRVAGDGLCILRAFKECMEVATGKEIVMDDIKENLRKEMSGNFLSNIIF